LIRKVKPFDHSTPFHAGYTNSNTELLVYLRFDSMLIYNS